MSYPPFVAFLLAASLFLSSCSAHQTQDSPPARHCPSVLIVGASGYIGSFLFEALRRPFEPGCDASASVTGIDRNPVASMRSRGVHALHCRHISDEVLSSVQVVLYLGGLSSRDRCGAVDWDKVVDENVNNVAFLASRMNNAQLLIFASTSAIADGLPQPANDDSHGDESSLDA
jgi:nucleoside-diphosphate-sugar epimerase